MTTNLIADMLIRIKNTYLNKQSSVIIKYTKINLQIIKILLKKNYINNFEIYIKNSSYKIIKIYLKYKGWWIKKPYLTKFLQISKPGRKIYFKYKNFKNKINILDYNLGIAIISTSSGILTHKEAIKLKIGGEILCYFE